jgi:Cys-tRNA(Pro)/Cys-tRNA(Cys) deacylase
MAKEKDNKTNVMRILDKTKIPYQYYFYDHEDGKIDGISVAQKLGQSVEQVYKTLVTRGASREFYVFVVPVAKELNLKAAAKSVGEKSVEMIHVDEINKITGYIRGGCSPVGMKKLFKTVIDSSCEQLETIIVSGGKIGAQVELAPGALLSLIGGTTAQIAE